MTQAPPDTRSPETTRDDEIHISGGGWFAIAAIGGFLAVFFIAGVILIGRTSQPTYTQEFVVENAAAGPVGEALASLSLIATEFAYEPPNASVISGGSLTLDNRGTVIHNIEIEGIQGFRVETGPGATATAVVGASAGSYTIFCSIPGHSEAGMVGTLVVVDG